jgi:transposase InsO family protein
VTYAKALKVSRTSIYKMLNSIEVHDTRDEKIIKLVKQIRKKMPRIGSLKLYHKLKKEFEKEGIKCGRDKFLKILKDACMLVPKKKKFIRTTQSNHLFNKHSNKVKGFNLKRPEQIWKSDITYIKTKEGNLYLSLITDAYSKKIMGYNISEDMKTESTKRALIRAIRKRMYPKRKLIHHSDRGFQYCNPMYTQTLEKEGIKISMTEKYDPYENSIAERVNGILKQEFDISNPRLSKQEAIKNIHTSIQIYNNERPHLSCKMMTPNMAHLKGKYEYKKWGKYAFTDEWN